MANIVLATRYVAATSNKNRGHDMVRSVSNRCSERKNPSPSRRELKLPSRFRRRSAAAAATIAPKPRSRSSSFRLSGLSPNITPSVAKTGLDSMFCTTHGVHVRIVR